MREPAHIPTGASGDDIIAIIRRWVGVLASGNYELIGTDLGYGLGVKRLGRPCSEIATAA
jgi:hypothetical protein